MPISRAAPPSAGSSWFPEARSAMPFATNGEVRICWESFGDPAAPAILLVNGLGSQMTRWPEAFCEVLTGRGYRALRFDNRDTGLSTWFGENDAYTLEDMAADARSSRV
jgi:pimeloyl-ACP methyl ester carboxylesterase